MQTGKTVCMPAGIKRFFMKTTIITISLALLSVTASAQRTLSADECVSLALANNVRMKNAANNIKAAEETRKEAFTKYFPSLSASGGGFIADKALMKMNVAEGMSMSLMKNGVVGGVTAQMPLFTGGRILNSNKLAAVNRKVSLLQHKQSENEVRLTATTYFWQIVMVKEKLKTILTGERQLADFAKDAEAAVSAGISDRNDMLQVRLRRNENLTDSIKAANMLNISRKMLAQYIGLNGDSIDVDMTLDGRLPAPPEQLYRSPADALLQTAEYGLLTSNVKASRLQYKLTAGKNMPTVAVGGGYMYDNLTDKNKPYWIGFATVSIPLSGWWGGSHDMKKQQLAVKNAENSLEDNSQLLMLGMENTWNDLTDAYKRVAISIESIAQAAENLRLHTDYYNAGTATMSDLLDAQTLYQKCRYDYVEAYAQYEIKRTEYLLATGQ